MRTDDDGATIDVTDTGPGIGDAHRDRIFDRFYRVGGRDPDGFGLGLAIVRDVATALGGQVIVRPDGEGTHVRVCLHIWEETT